MRQAERLRGAVEALGINHRANPPYSKVTLSMGLAPLKASSNKEVEDDLRWADDNLYNAKEDGRNRVVFDEQE